MVPGHPLTASTQHRPSGWVLWTTGTDIAAKLLAKNRKQMPCTKANHRLLLCLFCLLYIFSDNVEKLVTSENVQQTSGQQAIPTKSQLLNWYKVASVTRLPQGKKAQKMLELLATGQDNLLYLFFLNFYERNHGNSFTTSENLDQSPGLFSC